MYNKLCTDTTIIVTHERRYLASVKSCMHACDCVCVRMCYRDEKA
jgi:hypothetical protein